MFKLPRFLLDGDVRGAGDHVKQAVTPDGSIKAGHDRLGRWDRLRLPNSGAQPIIVAVNTRAT